MLLEHYSSGSLLKLSLKTFTSVQLREYAKELRDMVDSKVAEDVIQNAIDKQTAVIYNIVATCLGSLLIYIHLQNLPTLHFT